MIPSEYPKTLETRVIDLHFAADSMGLSSFMFFWRLRKPFYIFKEWRFGRSRASKVIAFGTNRKCVGPCATSCKYVIVTLVLFCTVSEILQIFVLMIPPVFHPNFGGVPLHQIGHVAVSLSRYLKLKLFGVEKHTWTSQTDRGTDCTVCDITALCIATRGKNAPVHRYRSSSAPISHIFSVTVAPVGMPFVSRMAVYCRANAAPLDKLSAWRGQINERNQLRYVYRVADVVHVLHGWMERTLNDVVFVAIHKGFCLVNSIYTGYPDS